MPRVNSSLLWDYFEKQEGQLKKAKCNICNILISFKTTIGNLKTHLKNKHIEAYIRVTSIQNETVIERQLTATTSLLEPSTSSTVLLPATESATASVPYTSTTAVAVVKTVPTKRPYQSRLDGFIPKKISNDQKTRINADLLNLFIDGYQPFSLVEEECFKNFCRWIPGYELPSRKYLSSILIPNEYERVRGRVRSLLNNENIISKICLTLDLWTSRTYESYIAVTGHFVTPDFNLKTVLLACDYFTDRHTSTNIKHFLEKTIQEWNINDKINFVISDNASNVLRAIEDLGWKHYGCYGHTLNLIVSDALKSVQHVIDKIKTIVRYFKKSTVAMEKLLKYQQNDNCIPRKLIQDVPTRWNSTYHMLQRFIELQSAIKATMAVTENAYVSMLTNEEWSLVAIIIKILKPFNDVTASLSGEKYITGSSVIVITRCLLKTCDNLLNDEMLKNTSSDDITNLATVVVCNLKEGLEKRFEGIERSGTFSTCTFLDPRYKTAGFKDQGEAAKAKKRVVDLVARLIQEKSPQYSRSDPQNSSTEGDNSNVKDYSPFAILNEMLGTNKPQRRSTPLSKAIQEVDLFLDDDLLPVHKENGTWNCPLEWWRNKIQKYPNLSMVARDYVNILATSVPCERIFSKTGLLISERRSRLDHKKVSQIMFLNINRKL